MATLLEQLFHAANSDPKKLNKLLQRNTHKLSSELAGEARRVFIQARDTGQEGLADAACIVASRIYLLIGQRSESLQSWLDYIQRLYARANTVEEYQTVREYANEFSRMALDIEALDLAFIGAVLAADCAFFAWQEQDFFGNTDGSWLQSALSDLVTASQWGGHTTSKARFEEYVSLLGAVLAEILESEFGQKPDFESRLQQLAVIVEKLIPFDFTFESREDALKTITVANSLAALSYSCGNPEAADARLDIAIDRAEQLGDLALWMNTVYIRYEGSKGSFSPTTEVSRLRESLRKRFEQIRLQSRSRAGRLWSTQEFNPILEKLLVDELNELDEEVYLGEYKRDPANLINFFKPEDSLEEFFTKITERLGIEELNEARVFHTIEALKARVLLDQMQVDFQELPTVELKRQAALLERQLLSFEPEESDVIDGGLASTESVLISQLPVGIVAYKGIKEDKHKYIHLLEMLEHIENLYATYGAGFREVAASSGLLEVMNALHPDEALIDFFVPSLQASTPYAVWIVAITVKKTQFIHVPLGDIPPADDSVASNISASFGRRPRDILIDMSPDLRRGSITVDGRQPRDFGPLTALVYALRLAIQQKDDITAQKYLETLYSILISPLFHHGLQPQDFHRWIIVPHGSLHYIPFVALSNPQGRRLIEEVALTILPSSSVWYRLQGQKSPIATSFLGLANPVFSDSNLAVLPDTEAELTNICKSLKSLECDVYKQKEATADVLQRHIAGKSIVHIATHGEFPEQDVIDFHRILLTPTEEHDGRVKAEDLHRMDLHSTRLLTLSICNGGLYRIGPGDEPYGLVAAALNAGAENILSTLWPLDDEMGRFFMIEFYKHLLQWGPAEALRQTCMLFIQDQANIKDWASFVLVGPGRPWKEEGI